eukprot:1858288-Amphidinium_carterae.1
MASWLSAKVRDATVQKPKLGIHAACSGASLKSRICEEQNGVHPNSYLLDKPGSFTIETRILHNRDLKNQVP